MPRIAQEALAALFLSLDDDRRVLVQQLTRLVLALDVPEDEREQHVAGFILHAVDAQNRERARRSAASSVVASVTPQNDVEPPVRMAPEEVVRALVRPSEPPPRKVAGGN